MKPAKKIMVSDTVVFNLISGAIATLKLKNRKVDFESILDGKGVSGLLRSQPLLDTGGDEVRR